MKFGRGNNKKKFSNFSRDNIKFQYWGTDSSDSRWKVFFYKRGCKNVTRDENKKKTDQFQNNNRLYESDDKRYRYKQLHLDTARPRLNSG